MFGKECEVMRVLVVLAPRSYREALAFSLRSHRPDDEMRIAAPDTMVREVNAFEPHLVVSNDVSPEELGVSVPSWVTIWFHDSLNATVAIDGQARRLIHDIATEDLLSILDETERSVLRG